MDTLANALLGVGIAGYITGAVIGIFFRPRGSVWPSKLPWATMIGGAALVAASGFLR